MQIDLLCPVENQGVTVKNNSKTGEPYALFKLFNLSHQVVTGISFMVRAFDAYGGELGEIRVDLRELRGEPKSFFAENKAVSLKDFAEAKHITVEFLEVQFEEDEPYIQEGGLTEIAVPEPDYDERIRLLSGAGDDAQCYAQDLGTHWICVCGRPNLTAAEDCVRCGRDKAEVMSKFSTRDALTHTLAEQEVARRMAEEAQKEQEEKARTERSAKRKKTALLAAVVIAALAVLWVIASLIYNGVMVLMGNSAAKNGDYLSAYARYAAADSSKLGEVSEEVRGSTNLNVTQSGLMTSDAENLYYIDMSYAIYKESKATGEKTRLGDAEGAYLNVMDGWVYYLDITNGQAICRIRTDGSEQEQLYAAENSYFAYLTVVGNELYFMAQEPLDGLTPELQEQMAAEGNSNIYQYRLYCLKIGSKRPRLVSDADIAQFSLYKGKIYFIDQAESAIYSMNRDGSDAIKLVSGPVYSYDIHNDMLYYSDGTSNEETGMPKLSLEAAALDGTHQETVVADKMVMIFGFEGDDIYYMAYENGNSVLRKKAADGDTAVVEGCQLFNMRDGYLVYINSMGQFMKTTFDKSGYEEVLVESVPLEPYDAEVPDDAEASDEAE